jgi:putative transposase
MDNVQQETASAAAKITPTEPKAKKLRLGKSKKPPPTEPKEDKPPPTRTKKIRLYPTRKQRVVLAEWFGAARWTYNECLQSIEKKVMPRKQKALRAHCINSDGPLFLANHWLAKTPYDVRNDAMTDLLNAYTTAFALLKSKKQKHFAMGKRSLKAASQSIVIRRKNWKATDCIFHAAAFEKLGAETTLRASEPIPDSIAYDCRLQRTRLGHYYFCLLIHDTPSENQAPLVDTETAPCILSIDPGVRTFATGYDPARATYVEWGKGDMNRFERIAEHLDDLMSRIAKEPSQRRRYKMRKAAMRMRLKIRNLVDEFHKKLTHWLVTEYDLVLLPAYNVSGMVNRTTRKISRPSVRAMLTWAPYRFKQRLLMKAALPGSRCHVEIVREPYTTKTCGECGNLNWGMTTEQIFDCPTCQSSFPRDWNAARNIFLRFVATSPWGTSLPGLSLGSLA